jgi:hypothetical protein
VLLGITNYQSRDIRACFVHPLQPQTAAYEVRLKDGSIINATAITSDANEAVLTDVSGVAIQADLAEIAQIRAGTQFVQDLAQVAWKATPPPAAAGSAPAPAPAPPVNPADLPAGNNVAPPANPAPPPPPPLVQEWLGKNQEQIMETGMGTSIEYPLSGKFRAFGTQIALSSDSPPNSTAIIHILADGREVAKSPAFRAGDPPRFLELTLANPAHITLEAESIFTGAKVLYIDPVAIKN